MLVRLEGQSLGYGSGAVLTGIDLTVGAGDRIVLLGRSGAGKSTLLGGLYDALVTNRHRVALAPQDNALVPQLSVLRNVLMGRLDDHGAAYNLTNLIRPRSADRAAVAAVLDSVGLSDLIDQQVEALSGGQKQRTALARAIYRGGEVLLADEPVSAVDETQGPALLARALEQFPAAVLALHDVTLARQVATRIVGLADGRIAFDAAPDNVTDAMIGTIYA